MKELAKQRVVIVGGGTGGVMTANRLARLIPQDVRSGSVEIIVINDVTSHLYQPGLLYVALDLAFPENFKKPQKQVLLPGVQNLVDPCVHISLSDREVICQSGKKIEYDILVIATGSVPDFDAIEGFREGAESFYTYNEAMHLRERIQTFDQGKLLLIIGVPHKCPVAPLEFIFMLDDKLRKTAKRDQVNLYYTYPIGRLHSLEHVATWAENEFERRNISSEIFFNAESIDPSRKKVFTLEGEEVDYDLLVGIPPHKGAKIIRDSKVAEGDGWIPTDRQTLQMKGQQGVYVVGDATDLPISKAGSTAHYESEVIAANIAKELRGEQPVAAYNGKVFCFIEAGLEEATHIEFDYQNPPTPSIQGPLVHDFKLAFNEMYWLSLRGLV